MVSSVVPGGMQSPMSERNELDAAADSMHVGGSGGGGGGGS